MFVLPPLTSNGRFHDTLGLGYPQHNIVPALVALPSRPDPKPAKLQPSLSGPPADGHRQTSVTEPQSSFLQNRHDASWRAIDDGWTEGRRDGKKGGWCVKSNDMSSSRRERSIYIIETNAHSRRIPISPPPHRPLIESFQALFFIPIETPRPSATSKYKTLTPLEVSKESRTIKKCTASSSPSSPSSPPPSPRLPRTPTPAPAPTRPAASRAKTATPKAGNASLSPTSPRRFARVASAVQAKGGSRMTRGGAHQP